MPRRQCPKCDSITYSSRNTTWECANCRMQLTSEHDVLEEVKDAADDGFCRDSKWI